MSSALPTPSSSIRRHSSRMIAEIRDVRKPGLFAADHDLLVQ
jgi:hypothetical protein